MTQSTGNTVILDGYVVNKNDSPEKKCKCTAIVSIPSNGSSKIVFNKLSSLQPNYNGCGSHISIQGSGQSFIQRCYISGSMEVKNQEHLEIELAKDNPPEDTRYCMKINIEDSSASLKVTCYSQTATTPSVSVVTSPAITSTSSEPITSPSVKIEDTTSTALSSTDTPEEDTTKQLSVTTLTSPTSYNTTSRPHISTTAIATENVTTNTVPSDIPETTPSKFPNTTLTHISTFKRSQATSSVTLDDISIESTSSDKTVPDTHATSPITDTTPLVTHTASNATLTTSPITQPTSPVTQSESPVTHTSSSVTHTTSLDKHTTHTVSFQSTPSSTHTTTQNDGITTSNATAGDSPTTRDAPTTKLVTPITQQTSISESSSQSITMTSIQNSTTTPTTKDPSAGGTSSDKDLPIEVVIPIAFVGGLLLIFLIICVFVGLRRNVCGCDDELVLQNNNLVDKVSVDIKNREKDTYVNPLYDDISLTGKSDRSDKDSMMQEIQSDDEDYTVDSYHIPVSTEIDGELWTHL